MLANDEITLRSFCARILGWVVVEHAIRSIELAIDPGATTDRCG